MQIKTNPNATITSQTLTGPRVFFRGSFALISPQSVLIICYFIAKLFASAPASPPFALFCCKDQNTFRRTMRPKTGPCQIEVCHFGESRVVKFYVCNFLSFLLPLAAGIRSFTLSSLEKGEFRVWFGTSFHNAKVL